MAKAETLVPLYGAVARNRKTLPASVRVRPVLSVRIEVPRQQRGAWTAMSATCSDGAMRRSSALISMRPLNSGVFPRIGDDARLRLLGEAQAMAGDHIDPGVAGSVRFALARALRATAPEDPRVDALARSAKDAYAQAQGADRDAVLEQLEALLAGPRRP